MKLFKTSNEIVAEIHDQIDTAQDRLLMQAREIISRHLDNTKAERLAAIGFVNTKDVRNHMESKAVLVKSREQAELVEYYKRTYPFQKFLTEEEFDQICKKYRLEYHPVENYVKTVPDKNLREIETAQPLKQEDEPSNRIWSVLSPEIKLFLSSKFGGIFNRETWTFPRVIEGKHFIDEFKADAYLHSLGYKTQWLVSKVENYTQNRSGLFIAAPKSHFKGKDKSIRLMEQKDPIVFRYVRGGIQVITKWGIEAEDQMLVNDILN